MLSTIILITAVIALACAASWAYRAIPDFLSKEWMEEARAIIGSNTKNNDDATEPKTHTEPLLDTHGSSSKWYQLAIFVSVILLAIPLFFIYGVTNPIFYWALGFIGLIIPLAAIDAKHQIIPDILVYPLLWLGLIFSCQGLTSITPEFAIYGAVAGYSLLWIISKTYELIRKRPAMGHGDMKLLAALGAWFGLPSLMIILFLACVVAIIAIMIRSLFTKNVNDPLPFGPSLAVSGMIYFIAQHSLEHFFCACL